MAKARGIAALVVFVASAAVIGAVVAVQGASGAASLPTLKIALTGVHGISISATTLPSGAVNFSSTFSGKLPHGSEGPSAGIIRLKPGVTIQVAAGAVESHHGDLDALTPYGALIVDAVAPGTVQTTLTPGNYVALNDTGNGQPGFAPFTVTSASSPAALPPARTTQTAIEFGFRGPTVLHEGTIVRAVNHGYLVHMIALAGVRDAATGRAVMALLAKGEDRKAEKLTDGSFASLLLPASPGALQQQVLHVKPGYYVEACFMDNQDHREHAEDGMQRLVRVVR